MYKLGKLNTNLVYCKNIFITYCYFYVLVNVQNTLPIYKLGKLNANLVYWKNCVSFEYTKRDFMKTVRTSQIVFIQFLLN